MLIETLCRKTSVNQQGHLASTTNLPDLHRTNPSEEPNHPCKVLVYSNKGESAPITQGWRLGSLDNLAKLLSQKKGGWLLSKKKEPQKVCLGRCLFFACVVFSGKDCESEVKYARNRPDFRNKMGILNHSQQRNAGKTCQYVGILFVLPAWMKSEARIVFAFPTSRNFLLDVSNELKTLKIGVVAS